MGKKIDLTGQIFGRLTVVGYSHHKKSRGFWHTQCSCGREKIIDGYNMKMGKIQSCGCFGNERRTKHGKYKTRAYGAWRRMKQRCSNPKDPRYKDYGGRGIKISPEWLSFERFYKDMGDCPEQHSIDRINNNGNYDPENCRWATRKQQQNNMRTNKKLELSGICMTMSQWAGFLGINKSTLSKRINRGNWSIKKALTI